MVITAAKTTIFISSNCSTKDGRCHIVPAMPVDPDLLEILACPNCKTPVTLIKNGAAREGVARRGRRCGAGAASARGPVRPRDRFSRWTAGVDADVAERGAGASRLRRRRAQLDVHAHGRAAAAAPAAPLGGEPVGS